MTEIRQVTIPEGTVAYREEGTGPPVVLVHGLLANGLLSREVVPRRPRTSGSSWPTGRSARTRSR